MNAIRSVLLICALMGWALVGKPALAVTGCHATTGASIDLSGRVDSLVSTARGGTVWALLGVRNAQVRFLPHDSLAVVHSRSAGVHRIALPPYLDAPGLAASPDGTYLYALIDSTLLTIDAASGEMVARQDLHLQAIGWPAAVTVGPNGDIYLIGQPAGAMAAQAYAFRPDPHHDLHLLWRTPLGLTHAGAWLGLAGNRQLAVYVPDQSDAKGVVGLLALNTGTSRRSYAVPIAPIAASAPLNRLYTAGAGVVAALALDSGIRVAAVSANGPLAVGDQGLVSFISANKLVVARGDNLERMLTLAFPRGVTPTALAISGSTLLVGNGLGITQIQLDSCRPA